MYGYKPSMKIKKDSITVDEISFIEKNSNLIDESTLKNGFTINGTTGEEIVNPSSSVTDFFPIKPATSYVMANVARWAVYDANYNFIASGTGSTINGALGYDSHYAKVVISNTLKFKKVAQMNEGSTLLDYEEYSAKKPKLDDKLRVIDNDFIEIKHAAFVQKSTNMINKLNYAVHNMLEAATGNVMYGQNYGVTDYMEIEPSTYYTHNVTRIAFYDENKTCILPTRTSRTVLSPATAKYIRCTILLTELATAQLNEGSTLLDYEEYYRPTIKSLNISEDYAVIDTDINQLFIHNVDIPGNNVAIQASKSADIYSMYDALVTAHPTYITRSLLCNEVSESNLPVYMYRFKPVRPTSSQEGRIPKFLILSGVHPEKTAVFTLYEVMNNICNNWSTDTSGLLEALRFNFDLLIVPVANPWGYDNWSRKNSNGVDMARNYPARWQFIVNPENATYGGTSPLTEVESQALNTLMLAHPDLLGVIDFHNNQGSEGSTNFLWLLGANKYMMNIAQAHIQKMTRKWQSDFDFVSQDADDFLGYVQLAIGGSIAAQANYLGYEGVTYEVCQRLWPDPEGQINDANVLTMAYEAFINFLLKLTYELLKRN